ncbi:actin-related 7 [Chlorella sorokiniana]|uniref:Actin-related 7 n=1 Tax=Chlorella sorokiniana TaxID=3076 RepID=A0A2P6TR13_CHLSO|nr:actin-related 7 [Chlorella sorokiniana]|eukprot:PRW56504.1 actin-related 7 [Chlorella sorokiniana]
MDVVVCDLGSRFLRAGKADPFPNDKEPWVIAATEATVQDAANGGTEAASADASAAAAAGGSSRIVHPIVQGSMEDWDVLEACLDHILYERIGWQRGKEGGILLAEPNFLGRDERERLCQLMFEVFNVAGYYGADQAVCSLYALGRLGGTVVDIGHSKIDIVPVSEGLAYPSTAQRLPYGCHDLAQHLLQQLSSRGLNVSSLSSISGSSGSGSSGGGSYADPAAVALDSLARSVACVATSGEAPALAAAAGEPTTHTLPDGQQITIQREGAQLGEALMDGSLLGADVSRLSEAIWTAAVAHTDQASRKLWLEGMMLCGGGSSIPGLAARLLREMRGLAPQSIAPGIYGVPDYMPEATLRHAAWMGGAVLARVSFSQSGGFLTKADYDEAGPAAVLRKCT